MIGRKELVDQQFLEFRCKLIEVAAFFDRVDRYEGEEDYRVEALRKAVPILMQKETGRAKAILETLSDPSREPIERAAEQGASGAPQIN